MLTSYKGRRMEPFLESAESFYQNYLKPNMAPKMVESLTWHQSQGHQTILLTGSIEYYLKPVVRDFRIDHLLCTHLEMDEAGILTGKSLGPVCVGSRKLELSLSLAEEHGIDLSQSYAYGNSHLDIPILKRVKHPVMVNPNEKLREFGEERAWPTL